LNERTVAGNTLEISWIQKPDDLVLLRMVVEESRVPLITAGRLPFDRHGRPRVT
jgi:hypothetical protein